MKNSTCLGINCVQLLEPSLALVFSPSGWDNEKKIAILHENLQTIKADDNFEDVIVKPPVRKARLHTH